MAGRRSKAYVCDCLSYLAIAVATVPLGLLASAAGWGQNQAFVLVASSVPPTAASLLAAYQESRPSGATPGKGRFGVMVTARDGTPISFGRAVVRNAVKIGIPWQVGHLVAVGAAFGGYNDFDRVTIAATAILYPLLAVMIACVLWGEGIAIHDRLAGTIVQPTRNLYRDGRINPQAL